MKRKYRIISVMLVIFILVLAVTGCTTGQPTGQEPDKTEAPGQTGGEETPAPEPKVLRIGIASAGRTENPEGSGEYVDDNWATDYIKENFGVPNNIDVQFEIIDDTSSAARQNYQLMMAARKAPDLFYVTVGSVAFVSNLAINGALADLKPSLDKYGPQIKEFLGEDFIETYGTFFGNLVAIPGKEEIPAISHYWIREDWLNALNLEMPENFEAWYEVMKTFKEKADVLEEAGLTPDADTVVPYAMYHTRYFTDWERIVTRFYPPHNFDPSREEYYIHSGYGTEYGKEGFKEGMQFMNQMYHEGLISPNFALDSEQQDFIRDIVNGSAGSYCDNLFNGWGPEMGDEVWHNALKKNIPEAKFEWCHPWTNKYDGVIRNPLDSVVLTYAFVPVYSEAVDEAIKYLNFVVTPEHMVNIQYGIEGVTYDMDPVLGPILKDEETLIEWGHGRGGREHVMLGRLPDRTWSRIQRSGARTKESAEYAERIHEGIESNGYMRFPLQMAGIPEKAMYEGGLRTPWEKFVASLIMAEPGTFDEVFEKGVLELESNGADKIIEARRREFQLMTSIAD
ncbi:MAG: extracellular solute-binding protein [Caldicoprobacterales bacterium]